MRNGTLYVILAAGLLLSCLTSKDDNGVSTTASVLPPKSETADTLVPWIDPLFFNEGQLCQHVRKIFEDSSGDLWFGTNVYELIHYDGDTLVYLSEEAGVPGGRITAITEDSKGYLWIGSSEGVIQYDGVSFRVYTTEHGLIDNEVWALLIDRDGLIWIGTQKGISIYDGSTFRTMDIQKADVEDPQSVYGYDRITTLMQDRDGMIWIGTDGYGITKYKDGAYTVLSENEGLADNVISDLYQDSKGRIWIATMLGGMTLIEDGIMTNLTAAGLVDGLEAGATYESASGEIWFAIENHGVYAYDGTSYRNYGEVHGLNTNGILAIREDSKGRFWFGGWGGLYRMHADTFTHISARGPWAP